MSGSGWAVFVKTHKNVIFFLHFFMIKFFLFLMDSLKKEDLDNIAIR